jgi:hypothetical protein
MYLCSSGRLFLCVGCSPHDSDPSRAKGGDVPESLDSIASNVEAEFRGLSQADRDKVWTAVQKIAATEEAPQAVRSGAGALARALDLIDVPEPGLSVREVLEEPLRDHGLGELRSWVVSKVAAKLRTASPSSHCSLQRFEAEPSGAWPHELAPRFMSARTRGSFRPDTSNRPQ